MAYELFCKTIQGAAHIKKDMPCEDYGMKYDNGTCRIFALGDGHGDANCPRSKLGSEYICRIAVKELEKFAEDITAEGWTYRLFDERDAKEIISQLVTSIIGKWSCSVNDEYLQNPLTAEESLACTEYIDRYRKGERIEHIYGTTLIAGLLTDDYLLLLQQGDGRCVVFNDDGKATQPIPWDDRCFANITTSICDTDAVQSCRYHIINLSENPVIACAAGSDGVEDSFSSMDKMHAYYRTLLNYACENGVEALESYLDETLPEFSANGSGDDTTICGFINIDAYAPMIERMTRENDIIIVKDKILRFSERIESMKNKLKHLEQKYSKANSEYIEAEKLYSEISNEYDDAERKLIMLELDNVTPSDDEKTADSERIRNIVEKTIPRVLCNHEETKQNQRLILEQKREKLRSEKERLERHLDEKLKAKDACEIEYIQYKERFDGFIAAREEAQKQLDELTQL